MGGAASGGYTQTPKIQGVCGTGDCEDGDDYKTFVDFRRNIGYASRSSDASLRTLCRGGSPHSATEFSVKQDGTHWIIVDNTDFSSAGRQSGYYLIKVERHRDGRSRLSPSARHPGPDGRLPQPRALEF